MFAKNLHYYRIINNMSMQELGERSGISANAIKKFEHGEMSASSITLSTLAKTLGVREMELLATWETNLDIVPLNFRKRSTVTQKEMDIIQNGIERELGKYFDVLSLFPMARLPVPENVGKHIVSGINDIEAAAMEAREFFGVAKIGPMPNLIDILENLGYLIVMVNNAPSGFDAQFGYVNGRPYIAIAQGRTPDRQRHSIAHEFGHIWLDPHGIDEEKAASAFAGALLLPKEDMIRELGAKRPRGISYEELRLVQREYVVSMKSVVKRAQQLNIINEATSTKLYKRLNWMGLSKDENSGLIPEQPSVFKQLVAQLTMEEEISLSRGAELLGINIVEMRNRLYGAVPAR